MASEKRVSETQWMLVISSEQERFVMLMEEALHSIANNLPSLDLLTGLESEERSLVRPTSMPFWTSSSQKDQGVLCIDIEVSSPVQQNTAWIRISRGVTYIMGT